MSSLFMNKKKMAEALFTAASAIFFIKSPTGQDRTVAK